MSKCQYERRADLLQGLLHVTRAFLPRAEDVRRPQSSPEQDREKGRQLPCRSLATDNRFQKALKTPDSEVGITHRVSS
jgi:hypothetical protein